MSSCILHVLKGDEETVMDGDGEGGLPGGILKPKDMYAEGYPRISGWDGIWCFPSAACSSNLFANFLPRCLWSLGSNTPSAGEANPYLAISRGKRRSSGESLQEGGTV